MKKGAFWAVLTCLIVSTLVLVSCSASTSTSTSKSTPTTTSASTPIQASTPIKSPILVSTTTLSSTTAGNWWDTIGKPQYGGMITLRLSKDLANFDPYNNEQLINITSAYMERLHGDNWTLDPAIYNWQNQYRTSDYVKGNLAASWEFPDPSTYLVHLRQGIHWQNIPPANGRELTADDIVFHYDRLFGLGDGFTKPGSYWATVAAWQQLISVTATDKYTVIFKWKTANPEFIMETLQTVSTNAQVFENPESVKQWGDLNDWRHAIGTGPFILTDFVSGSSATLVKNPNYWGYDERYPQNQLPYIDTLKYLIIPDDATALAAMRTHKIDFIDNISLQNALSMHKTNPEILQISIPLAQAITADPRNDKAPFNDLRVRKAMQMAIDLPTIATSYYGGTCPSNPSSLTSQYMTGWGFPYNQWPQDLKDEYAYNPTQSKQLLVAAGYPNGFKTDIVVDSASDIDLLQVVKSYFAAIGIDMDIRVMDSASWTAFVSIGHKQDALAMRPAGMLGQSYEPLRQLNKFQTGNGTNFTLVSDPVFDTFYPKALADTNVGDIKQVLIDANKYVTSQHFSISLLQPNLFALYQPWLKGYSGQSYSLSGGTGSPTMVAFYLGRFWIDQNLKKSLGY